MEMRLQAIGIVKAVPAAEVKEGDVLTWNFGHRTLVKSVDFTSPKTVKIVEEDEGTGIEYNRTMRTNRPICKSNTEKYPWRSIIKLKGEGC